MKFFTNTILYVLILFILISCKESNSELHPTEIGFNEYRTIKWVKFVILNNGYYQEFHENKKIKIQARIINDSINGYYREFSTDGILIWEGICWNSKRVYLDTLDFQTATFSIIPKFPDTISLGCDSIRYRIDSKYHPNDFFTIINVPFVNKDFNKNTYSFIPYDTGYIRIAVISKINNNEWKYIDSIYVAGNASNELVE